MKKISILALAAAGLLLGACSDKNEVVQEVPQQNVAYDNGYISVGINLPTQPQNISRATSTNDNGYPNDNFELNDGDDSEYTVSSAYLIVFSPGATEDEATFKTAFNLNTQWAKNSDPQVTTSTRENIVRKVGAKVAKGDLALVVLNPNSLITFAAKEGTGVVDGEQTVTINGVQYSDSKTFGDYKAELASSNNLNAEEMHTANFYMTNTPLYAAQGSSTTSPSTSASPAYRTLVPIEHVYETEAAARSGEASEIFVERGMAKVTLGTKTGTLGTQMTTTTEASGSYTTSSSDIPFTIDSWTLDQTNSKSYLVRSTDGYSDFINLVNGASKIYRFTGNIAILDQNHPGYYKYRGYFAKDPNYNIHVLNTDGTAVEGAVPLIYYKNVSGASFTKTATSGTYSGAFAPKYCFENTFDVERQERRNTTLAQIKVNVGTGSDLYTINGVTSKIYDGNGLQTAIKNVVLEYCKANGKMGSTAVTTQTSDELFADVTIAPVSTGSYEYEVTAITHKTGTDAYFMTGIDTELAKSEILSAINSQLGKITKYTGGVSYYAIRIKHFGDELTPWHVGTNNSGKSSLDESVTWIWSNVAGAAETIAPTAGNVYPNNNANDYLGRYGVLRNNWYDIQVMSIKTLGSPVPLDYSKDDTTDDELDGYINLKINIMSWAKRTQNWNL